MELELNCPAERAVTLILREIKGTAFIVCVDIPVILSYHRIV